ncbi:unnamed protein product [Ilex paraguariensis]|uniref:beta-galactosidase n=1 Tax=Ilex paraguariensis TaxID=185542 RepID=A0ABC8T0W8_9AQUA
MAMQSFIVKIVNLMKSENLLESQGGSIILSQIENEYGPQGKAFGAAGHQYITLAANLAVGLESQVSEVGENQIDSIVVNDELPIQTPAADGKTPTVVNDELPSRN